MYRYLILILILSFAFISPTWSKSLFDEDGCVLFTMDRANKIGDLVTILIAESTQATNRSGTETKKKLNTDGELTLSGFLEWITDLPPVIQPLKDMTFTPSENFSGEGKVTTSGSFTTRLTATVIDILPNGNLVIEGKREITVAKDKAFLTIRGVIQPDDLSMDNTIASYKIAELQISYQGKGIIAERQKDGLLSRIFNFLF